MAQSSTYPGQFNANCAKLMTARVTSSRFSQNKSCCSAAASVHTRVRLKADVSATGLGGSAGRCCLAAVLFDGNGRMKKHKRDYYGSMESARSAAGSCCSQSRPRKGFIDSPERLWNETLYCCGIITALFFGLLLRVLFLFRHPCCSCSNPPRGRSFVSRRPCI